MPFNQKDITHQDIIDISKKLFPKTSADVLGGVCHGLAMMGMQAILVGKMDPFNKLLVLLKKMPEEAFHVITSTLHAHEKDDLDDIKELIEIRKEIEKQKRNKKYDMHDMEKLINLRKKTIEELIKRKMERFKTKHKINFELKWQDLIDIEAFFTGINLYLTPNHNEFAGLFESGEARPKVQLEGNRLLPLLPINVIKKENSADSSNDVIQQQTIHPVMSFSGCYSKDELRDYFKTFTETYKSSNATNPISFVLENHNHSIAIGYDPNKHRDQAWTFIDANNLPAKACHTNLLIDYVFNALEGDENAVYFNTTVYAIKNVVNEIDIQTKPDSSEISEEKHNKRLHDKLKKIRIDNIRAEALFKEISKKLHSGNWKQYPKINTSTALRVSSETGNSLLYMAARYGHIHQVKALIEKGADINQANNNRGITPLWIAAQNGHVEIVVEIVDALIKKGATLDQANSNGETPLWMAALSGHLKVVNTLIAAGADLNKGDSDGTTPLWIAAQNGHVEIVVEILNALIKKGATLDQADNRGITPIWIAAQNGHLKVVKVLIKNGAKVDQADNGGITPLWKAAQNGHLKVVKVLIKNGAKVDQADNGGITPLWKAAQNGHLKVVKVLIKNGAKVDQADNLGITPLRIAAGNGHADIVSVLIKNGAKNWVAHYFSGSWTAFFSRSWTAFFSGGGDDKVINKRAKTEESKIKLN